MGVVLLLLIAGTMMARIAAAPFRSNVVEAAHQRQSKNLAYFDYMQPEIDYESYNNEDYIEENELSRAIPTRKRTRPSQYNSPIYYIRLPPQPYVYVPGLGYMSQPTSNPMNQFLNIPVSFVANGKPNSIYQWNGDLNIPTVAPPSPSTTIKPIKKPDSTIHRIPGQFMFNGRPTDDIYVLRDSYNSLYGDVLQNLYP